MDTARFLTELAQGLNDPLNVTFSVAANTAAMYRATREYSRYFPLYKRIGTGNTYAALSVGATSIQVCGGPFLQGSQIILEPGSPFQETVTITAPPAFVVGSDGVGQQVNLTVSATLYSHLAGAPVSNVTPGVVLAANQQTYPLPVDFIRIDQSALDVAVGSKASIERTVSYYDALYSVMGNLSSVGIGQSQGFGSGYVGASDLNTLPGNYLNQSGTGQTVIRFVQGAFPQMVIIPAPGMSGTLDLWYYAQHIPQTVPDAEMEGVLAYAKYSARMNLAQTQAAQSIIADDDVKQDFANSAKMLMALADMDKKDFDTKIRRRPYMTVG